MSKPLEFAKDVLKTLAGACLADPEGKPAGQHIIDVNYGRPLSS